MKVAIVHYHLQSGGVTRIINHQVSVMKDRDVDVVVFTGKAPPGMFPGRWKVVEGLQYEDDRPAQTGEELFADLIQAAKESFGSLPDLWHIHNHSLGKSMILPSAIVALAESRQCLLLQLHDFAEDGRPDNYRTMVQVIGGGCKHKTSRILYPRADNVHYSVLNCRDFTFLKNADEDPDNIHLLHNPVGLDIEPEQLLPADKVEKNLWMYPTRAIRRKNLGELLLWAALANEDQTFATTLGPDNPREWVRYNRWKTVAHQLDLPVEFEMGGRQPISFVSLLQQARAFVTTSVAEGFGMAFLEPWLVQRPVTGRNLHEITGDFTQNGICFPWSYDRLDVPVAWVGDKDIVEAVKKGLEHSMESYGRKVASDAVDRVLGAWIKDGMVDYGRLDEQLQEKVLFHVALGGGDKETISPSCLMEGGADQRIIDHNRSILTERYSLEEYGNTLYALYEKVCGSSISAVESLNGEKLLDAFLAPERLHLLQVD